MFAAFRPPVCLLVLLFALSIRAQFFTKSSKSIPRMGRRSDPTISARRALIDTLVDEIGPSNLLSALEARAAAMNSNEVAISNEQPIDYNPSIQIIDDEPVGLKSPSTRYEQREELSRFLFKRTDETGSNGHSGTSLAMRALNAERYLRHLASGQPLMALSKLEPGNQRQQEALSKVGHEFLRDASDRKK